MENNKILMFDGEQKVTVVTKCKYKQIKTDETKYDIAVFNIQISETCIKGTIPRDRIMLRLWHLMIE